MINKIICKVSHYDFAISTGASFDNEGYISIACFFYTEDSFVIAMANNRFGVWWS